MSDVLIVGAGPTGLVLANELNRRGISFRLIESREGPEGYSRAVGIQSRTLEIFEKMGLLPSFFEKGKKIQEIFLFWKNKQLTLSLKDLDAPYPFTLSLEQSETENILRQHLEKNGGKVEWNTRLMNLNNNETVIQLPSGKVERMAFPWIVGCDGAHSTVRHALNLPFRGIKIPEVFLLADVISYSPIPFDGPQIFLSHKGFGLLIPFQKENTYRIVLPDASETHDPKVLTSLIKDRGFKALFEIRKIEAVSTFQIQRRRASRFRINQFFLAGDAAHIHSPFGGQGMNTSIQDAFNLGWKLALVIQGDAPESLLDSYEEERMPVAKKVLKETTRLTRFLTFSQKRCPPLFYWGMRFMLATSKRRQMIAESASEIAISYPKGSIVCEPSQDKNWKGPHAGQRAPDCPLANGKRLFKILESTRFILLLFQENPSFVEAIEKSYGTWINVYVIKGEAAKQRYAAETESIYIIRPDGYIGFRSQRLKTEEVISYLLRVFRPLSSRNKS